MVKKTIINKLKRFRKLLEKEGIPVEKLILFGSQARGTAHKDSDIDVCVISPIFGKDPITEKFKLLYLGPQIDTRIQAVPFSTKDFLKNKISPLLHEIRQEGIDIKN